MTFVRKFRKDDDAAPSRRDLDLFVRGCAHHGIPSPHTEHRFAEGRKFAFDYAWPSFRVALEKEGGVFTRQAHGSISGILRDIEKYNLAASLGWRVLRVIPSDIVKPETFALVRTTLTND